MSPITTHVLDTTRGKPGCDIKVTLEIKNGESFKMIGTGVTDSDGRVKNLLADDHTLVAGIYRIGFNTQEYYSRLQEDTFYPEAQITFNVVNTNEHYHVPLLISGYGYSTYRGS